LEYKFLLHQPRFFSRQHSSGCFTDAFKIIFDFVA